MFVESSSLVCFCFQLTNSHIIPELQELLADEELNVRVCALSSLVEMLDDMTVEVRKKIAIPALKVCLFNLWLFTFWGFFSFFFFFLTFAFLVLLSKSS